MFQILVKKIYDKAARRARRNWKLKRLKATVMETDSVEKYLFFNYT